MQSNFWIFLCQFMLTRMFRNTFKVQKPGVNNWKFSRLDNAKKVIGKSQAFLCDLIFSVSRGEQWSKNKNQTQLQYHTLWVSV